MERTISRFKALDLIRASNGKFFTVTFVKRTTGELRRMNCRLGVKKGLAGKGMGYDPLSKGVIPVYDTVKDSYRMINLETVTEIHVGGKEYKVVPMDSVPVPGRKFPGCVGVTTKEAGENFEKASKHFLDMTEKEIKA